MVAKVWCAYRVSAEWKKAVQIPITKVQRPQATDDYRRITLCCVAYNIYATLLLEELEKYLSSTSYYQEDFTKSRSTEVHIFAIRRTTEEYWRNELRLWLLAVDLKKAFDSIYHCAILTSLLDMEVPFWWTGSQKLTSRRQNASSDRERPIYSAKGTEE